MTASSQTSNDGAEPVMTRKLRFQGKAVLVTGASGGIGSALAVAFAEEGAGVGVHYLSRRAEAENVARRVRQAGQRALTLKADIRKAAQAARLVDRFLARFGRIDVLVNSAGAFFTKPLLETDEAEWDLMMDTDVTGAFLCSRAAAQAMMKQQTGRIINLSSVAAFSPLKEHGAYGVAKAAVEMLTKTLAFELAPHGITVNAVGPGYAATAAKPDVPGKERRKYSYIPQGRRGHVSHVVAAALHFAGEEADHTTGQVLYVDGGWVSHLDGPRQGRK